MGARRDAPNQENIEMGKNSQDTKRGAKTKKAKEVSRATRLARAYRELMRSLLRKCDVVSVGEGMLHCFTHDCTWSRCAMELGAECPKSREDAVTAR
jgi:hypothetical protein